MKLKYSNLLKYVEKIFVGYKLSKKHAAISAKYLVDADFSGVNTHGLARVSMYCMRLKKKLIKAKPKIKIKKISSNVFHLDADNSIGMVAADMATDLLIQNTKKNGIVLVGVKNSGHYGMSGLFAEKAAKAGLMVWCYTNAPPFIPPHGTIKPLFGTNPICFACPTHIKGMPFVLDMSTSSTNRGKLQYALKVGKQLEPGMAFDKDGNPTIDPVKALTGGMIAPMATYKGSGLAWMIDIISGVMTGANHAGRVKDPYNDLTGPQNVSHMFIGFKADLFLGKNYNKRIKENISIIKKLPKKQGVENVFYPGENKKNIKDTNMKTGVVVDPKILEELHKTAKDVGLNIKI